MWHVKGQHGRVLGTNCLSKINVFLFTKYNDLSCVCHGLKSLDFISQKKKLPIPFIPDKGKGQCFSNWLPGSSTQSIYPS